MVPTRLQLGLLVLAAGFAVPAWATIADLPRTSAEITIDGVMDEPAWQEATRVDLDYETRPGENIDAPVRTTVYLIEDGESLYLAFDAEDPDPKAIRAYLRDRDSAWSDDFVGIALDTFNDERRAFQFFANPLGAQMDATNDDVNQREDDSWDAIWSSAGKIHDTGYIVEMQIPLNQLRFPSTDGKQTWGYDLLRFYPRDHRYRLSNNPQDRNRNCYLCQLSKLQGLEGSEPGRDLEIVPTVTASRTDGTDDPGVEPLTSGGTDTEAGVSVRWGITPDITANLTINPDFSQIEADVAQLDVNERFALFFPERRPFFLEGADYYNTLIDAVFTRNIADPDVGGKLTGKRGDHTFGVFSAQDAVTNLLIPGVFGSDTTTIEDENTAFVGRYSYGFGEASFVGGLVTVRDGDEYHNYVGGVDGRWKISDQHSLAFQYLESDTEYPDDVALEFEQPTESIDGDALSIEYEYDSRNWFANVEYADVTEEFRADLGFVTRVGGEVQEISGGRVWHGEGDDFWSRIVLHGEYEEVSDENGGLLERDNSLRLNFNGPMQSFFQTRITRADEVWEGVRYDLDHYGVYGEFQPRGGLLAGLLMRFGDQIDYSNDRLADTLELQPFVNWNINRNLLMRFRGAYSRLETPEGEKIFDASVADMRLTWQFNLRSFVRITIQYQDIEKNQAVYVDEVDANETDVGRQVLYSYKLNPRTVFFLGYSDLYVENDGLNELEPSDRTWFMKISYAWTP